jgi:hypothetical protein
MNLSRNVDDVEISRNDCRPEIRENSRAKTRPNPGTRDEYSDSEQFVPPLLSMTDDLSRRSPPMAVASSLPEMVSARVIFCGEKPAIQCGSEVPTALESVDEIDRTLMARQKIADTLCPMTLSEILQELPRLTEEERQELREVLDGYDPEPEHAWAQLAKERFRGIKAGERITVDGDEVLAEGRRLAQKQAQQ